jgi:rare lipoprotein A
MMAKTVLVVEDDPILCVAAEEMFVANGFKVKSTNRAEHAVKIVAHCAAQTVFLFIVLLSTCVAARTQSWIGEATYYGARTQMTCAHRFLPFGTHVRVTNLANNRSVVLIVYDRGPFMKGRIIDVSTLAADMLGFRRAGVAQVELKSVTD